MAGTAAKAAPAVLAIGALAAVPQVHDLFTSSSQANTEGQGTAPLAVSPSQAGSTAAINNTEAFRIRQYRAKHANTSIAGGSARVHKTHHPVAHDSDSAAGNSSASASSGSSSSHASSSAAATGGKVPVCSGSGGMLPDNFGTIVDFLVQHGYTPIAAAGVAGNIFQESKGNPESVGSGGGGLIGWTPLPPGFVTGNPAADLQTQLNALLTYNEGWHQFIPALNAATSPAQAAFIYMTDFERPGLPVATNREGAAEAVAAACGI